MKFPSIAVLGQGLSGTLRRWPLSILLATVASILLMRVFNDYSLPNRERTWTIILSCYEGMLLTIAATILAESRHWTKVGKVLIQALALGLALLFYFWLPVQDVPRVIICLVVTMALHWLIAVLPYAAPAGGPVGFWDYNRKLFLRALQTVLYTLVLYAGITLALLAIEHLFGLNFVHAYTNVWWTLAGIFSPVFFLAGFPSAYARPETINDYPRGLKVFTQYVLLPIVTIYLGILYAYLFKILFTAHWPSGWVAWLVLGFSVAGILALLLIYPLRDDEGNRWIRSYSRFFYLALIPLIVLLWVAIGKRMGSYGITEGRYYVVLLAAWLSGIACYFVLSDRKDIRVIPASLCVLSLLSLWGPWSARSVSLASQMGRMQALLEKNGLFADGRIVPAKRPVSLEDRKQLSSMAEYIMDMHHYRVLQPWFRTNLDSAMQHDEHMREGYSLGQAETVLRLMGIEYTSRWSTEDEALSSSYQIDDNHPVMRTGDVDYIVPDVSIDVKGRSDPAWSYYEIGKDSVGMRIDSARHALEITLNGVDAGPAIDLRPLENVFGSSSAAEFSGGLSQTAMTLENDGYRIVVTTATAMRKGKTAQITHMRGYLLGLTHGKK